MRFPVALDRDGFIGEEERAPNGNVCHVEPFFQDDFEFPRNQGRDTHHATDIFAGTGTLCYAIEAGRVERLFNRDIGPYGVRLHGEHGVWTYSHMSDAFPENGDEVEAGDPIGRVGNEGNARNVCPHLHFGWKPPGRRLTNPYPLLRELADGGDGSVALSGGRVNGERDAAADEDLVEAINIAETLLLAVAEQWERTRDREAVYLAEQVRSVVDGARRHFHEAPDRVYAMLRDEQALVLNVQTDHPEWFEDDSVIDDLREAIDTVRAALHAAGEAGAGLSMAFGSAGLVFVLFVLFAMSGGFA